MTASEMIKHCRRFRGITQKKLAEKAGISKTALSNYERGLYEPKLETMQWILEACGFELRLAKKEKKC